MNEYLHVIYCDDIRHEINGKASLIGTYGPHLFASSFPIKLPKLCAQMYLFVREVTQPTEFTVRVTNDSGKEILKLCTQITPESPIDNGLDNHSINAAIEMPFLEFEEETTLHVSAQLGEQKFDGPHLQIRKAPATQQPLKI